MNQPRENDISPMPPWLRVVVIISAIIILIVFAMIFFGQPVIPFYCLAF